MSKASWLIIAIASALIAGCGPGSASAEKKEPKEPAKPALTELVIEDVKVGTGKVAAEGDLVFVEYEGKFADGEVFDSTARAGGRAFKFTLGAGEVIKGWDQGVAGMKVKGERNLSIPYSLGYGEQGNPPTMPPRADLYFNVKLLDLVKKDEKDIIDKTDTTVGTGPAAAEGRRVTVTYTGTLANGEVFDSTEIQGEPYTFTVGDGSVFGFFETAILGMRKGGKRNVRIPPAVGFGPMGGAGVGPNEILYYEIEMVDVK